MARWKWVEEFDAGEPLGLWKLGDIYCVTLRDCSPNTTGVWRTMGPSPNQLKAIAPMLLSAGHLDGTAANGPV